MARMSRTDILIVDDNADFADFVRQVAASERMSAEIILNSADFEEAFKRLKPRIVVLDIEMPGIGGMQLAQWLGGYASEHNLEVAVLIISGFGRDAIRICRAVADLAGIDIVRGLSKPVEFSTLAGSLKELQGL